MLTDFTEIILILFFLLFLLFWPGFVLQHVLIQSKDALEVFVYSTAFGLAFLTLICPVLDLMWGISFLSLSCSVVLLSGLLLVRKPAKLILPQKWEIVILVLILGYGFLLRSYTLFDILPEGQDAWRHLSFMYYIHQTHALPDFLPWAEPLTPVTIMMYPPGSHCIGALVSYPLESISFTVTKIFFIGLGTGSSLSAYIVFKQFLEKKTAVLSAFFVAVFTPHMIMTTEVTAEAVSIFVYPLVPYLFYKKKVAASAILLGGIMLIHHLTALAVVIPLFTMAVIFSFKKREYLFSLFSVSVLSLLMTLPWWSQRTFHLAWIGREMAVKELSEAFFHPYIEMVSPLFIILSMIGFFIILKERKEYSLFLIAWGVALFVASQPLFPVRVSSHRFLAFFIFPCSVMASLGLLKMRTYLKPLFFVLILLVFSTGSPPHFWPTTGEENLLATQWVKDSTLDSVIYVYDPHYTFVYPLSARKIYGITDFDNPFDYEGTYFYDDAAWVFHDISQFGQFDRLYSCSGVVIHRIEKD